MNASELGTYVAALANNQYVGFQILQFTPVSFGINLQQPFPTSSTVQGYLPMSTLQSFLNSTGGGVSGYLQAAVIA